MAMRRVCQQAGAAMRRSQLVDDSCSSSAISRLFATLPEDIAQAARKARFPAKLQPSKPNLGAAAAEAAAQPATPAVPLNVQQEGAKIATAWMFPWERRQMSGGALRPWEKLYWGVFVVGLSVLLFNRLREAPKPPPDPAIAAAKEAAKAERARMVLSGASVIEGEEDPFDGLAPEEIQKYVEEATGANAADPFEGMSPEEINEYVRTQQGGAAAAAR